MPRCERTPTLACTGERTSSPSYTASRERGSASRERGRRAPARSAVSELTPPAFQKAVDELLGVEPRSELRRIDIAPPRRLAPHSFALGVELADDEDDSDTVAVTGRLILLHDPEAQDTWNGTFRM